MRQWMPGLMSFEFCENVVTTTSFVHADFVIVLLLLWRIICGINEIILNEWG